MAQGYDKIQAPLRRILRRRGALLSLSQNPYFETDSNSFLATSTRGNFPLPFLTVTV